MGPVAALSCAMLLAIDGDTISCDGITMRALGDGAPYVSGFDTPEIGRYAACPQEALAGFRAGARMAELLATPGLRVEDSGAVDRFDRPLVTLRLPDGRSIGHVLIAEGLAVEWRPGRSHDWCAALPELHASR